MSAVGLVLPAEAHTKMKDEGFTYVDVRTPDEFAAGHPAGAVNVPVSLAVAGGMVPNPDFVTVMEKAFAKDAPIILGCKTGARSAKAGGMLASAGFTRLLDQTAGWEGKKGAFGEVADPGWSKTSLPSETGQPADRSYAAISARAPSA